MTTDAELADRLEGMLRQVGHPDYSLTEFFAGIKQIIAALRREPEPEVCPRCKGSGEAKGMTYGHGPDDYEIDVPCPACNGTGERPPSGEMVMLKKLLQASESMRHGGYRDALVAAYDGWAHEARAMLTAAEAEKGGK